MRIKDIKTYIKNEMSLNDERINNGVKGVTINRYQKTLKEILRMINNTDKGGKNNGNCDLCGRNDVQAL